jgi:hypothetical protein
MCWFVSSPVGVFDRAGFGNYLYTKTAELFKIGLFRDSIHSILHIHANSSTCTTVLYCTIHYILMQKPCERWMPMM